MNPGYREVIAAGAEERRDDEEAARLVDAIPGGGILSLAEAIEAVAASDSPEHHHICQRLDAARNVRGETSITREHLRAVVEGVLRDAGRARPRSVAGRRAMTIQRAKNRESGEVLVVWPHSTAGSIDHQRRLLYNAVTRAKHRCSIVVFGQGRTGKAPFTGDSPVTDHDSPELTESSRLAEQKRPGASSLGAGWARREARRRKVGYQTVINEALLEKAE